VEFVSVGPLDRGFSALTRRDRGNGTDLIGVDSSRSESLSLELMKVQFTLSNTTVNKYPVLYKLI
jgi:hypothetical protein